MRYSIRYSWTAVAFVVLTYATPVSVLGQGAQNPKTHASQKVPVSDDIKTPRAWLGVLSSTEPKPTDSLGPYIDAVTPGGPADQAGLQSGAVITKLAGRSLTVAQTQGIARHLPPWQRLTFAICSLVPNDTVTLEFLTRDGKRKTAILVPRTKPPSFWSEFVATLGSDNPPTTLLSTLADLKLAPLNRDLGEYYFGTTKGVLVIDVPKDGAGLGLKSGDVVQKVDNREAVNPITLMRILQSYQGGEKLKLEVVRRQKPITITARLEKATVSQR